MKINRHQLGEVLLDAALNQFQSVPPEDEIDHAFSQSFQTKIRSITQKSESAVWRVWQTPVKRAVLIAILVMITLATVACATPAIRNAIIDFFFIKDETAYGITFDPYQAVNAPCRIDNVYIPSFNSKGYTLVLEDYDSSGVEFLWMSDHNEYIYYTQSVIHQDITASTWIGIDAEATDRTTKNINGYLVEIISNKENRQYVAVWTDNRYIYSVDISVMGDNQEAILKEMMDSITEVKTID